MSISKLPVGIQDFADLITNGYVYVDKTEYLHKLITQGKPYFLSRPRRFGKSMTISTLEAIFKNKRELFKGLWIDQSDWEWQEYPVIRLDMSSINRNSAEVLRHALIERLKEIAQNYDLTLTGTSPSDYLRNLIIQLAKTQQVVVLVDEYDKPIIDNLNDFEKAKLIREELKDFYAILKAEDADLKFVFISGVTKFSKVSVFSGLNNLDDVTMSDHFSAMTGYTEGELKKYFDNEVHALATHLNIDKSACYDEIKSWYNGYKFSENGQHVYNPFSVLRLLKHQAFKPHWFQTGTPTFLLELLAEHEFNLDELEAVEVSASSFDSFEIKHIPLLPLLYQTGYLTIKHYDPTFESYVLHHPNREVSQAFTESLITYFATRKADSSKFLIQLYRNLAETQWDANAFVTVVNNILALMPYDLYLNKEKHYHSLFYLMLKLAGIKLHAEFKTQLGRADACLIMKDKIIIFELKLNKNAQEAMTQIHKKKYYEMVADRNLPIYLMGINFDGETKNINDHKVEQR